MIRDGAAGIIQGRAAPVRHAAEYLWSAQA